MSDNQAAGAPEGRATPAGGQVVAGASPGEERAAVLLKSLPGELANVVLGRMVPENATRLRARMQAAPPAGSPEADPGAPRLRGAGAEDVGAGAAKATGRRTSS